MEIALAIRQLQRAPGTAVAAIVTLAVGIGATTAVFSFVAAVMSAASPAADMDRLVGLWSHQQSEAETKGLVTPADFLEWSTRAQSFDVMAAWRGASFNVSAVGNPVRASGQLVTPGYLRVFDWQPVLGRGFTESDARPGARKGDRGVVHVLAEHPRRPPGRDRPVGAARWRAGDGHRGSAAHARDRRLLRADDTGRSAA